MHWLLALSLFLVMPLLTGFTDRHSPIQVPDVSHVAALATGFGHSLLLRDDQPGYAWGENGQGQLGVNVYGGSYPSPTPIRFP